MIGWTGKNPTVRGRADAERVATIRTIWLRGERARFAEARRLFDLIRGEAAREEAAGYMEGIAMQEDADQYREADE